MLGYSRQVTQHATHYHTQAVNPVWSAGLVETTTIGTHVFYRMPNRSERAYYQEALARRRGVAGATRSASEDLIPEVDAAEAAPTEAAPPAEQPEAIAPEVEAQEAALPAVEGEVAT
jgi:hypothetical protein